VREAAGYLDANARCQACGYLHETQIQCATGERGGRAAVGPLEKIPATTSNGAGKIALTRDELVELLAEVTRLKY